MAEAMGISTACVHKLKVFVLAAVLAAVSGWLFAHLQRFVNPTPFNLNIGIELPVHGGGGRCRPRVGRGAGRRASSRC
jgi:branched-chain amino acid transport system permease protein